VRDHVKFKSYIFFQFSEQSNNKKYTYHNQDCKKLGEITVESFITGYVVSLEPRVSKNGPTAVVLLRTFSDRVSDLTVGHNDFKKSLEYWCSTRVLD
jgi:hypothetical protein